MLHYKLAQGVIVATRHLRDYEVVDVGQLALRLLHASPRARLIFAKVAEHEVVVVRAEVHDFGARVSRRWAAMGRATVSRVRF